MTGTELDRATGHAAPIIDRFARFGFAVKGIVTILIGALALRYALGWGGDVTGPRGALEVLVAKPFDQLILAVLAAGLACYAFWMFVEAIVDPEQKGFGFPGLAERVAFFVTGLGYALLANVTVNLLLGRDGPGGVDLDDLAATVLTPRVGRWFVGLVGVIVMIAGLLQLRLGVTADFRNTLRQGMARVERAITMAAGVLGYVTLGVLSMMVGYSLVQVAILYDPSEAGGWEEALWLLDSLVEGRWLLGLVSAGLILYGFYFVLLMRYRSL
ncbi:MAG TPA: DUF1206 domain-containing protein [Gemmatimonadales bacterium]|nr:DUF1206 domain-containing protein [Gemmatimonadales bacterium]